MRGFEPVEMFVSGFFDGAVPREGEYVRRAHAVLALLSYKPGWRFSVHQLSYGIRIVVDATVVDATDFSKKISITGSRTLSDLGPFDERLFVQEVYQLVREVELHEVREFFKVNTQHWEDPHPELRHVQKASDQKIVLDEADILPAYVDEAQADEYLKGVVDDLSSVRAVQKRARRGSARRRYGRMNRAY